MISKVTKDNKALYEARLEQINNALFIKRKKHAMEVLGKSEADAEAWALDTSVNPKIDSFNSYFSNIREIRELTTNFEDSRTHTNTPGKYLLMPLDEPLFEIDANKRTITIPSTFSKNGIGVRGDHMAETLYFRVDRFFDYQDLFAVDEIIINWQFRPANASRNTEIPMNTSLAFAPDDEYIPGSIVFGWVIEQDMTPSKGTLSFSVSFVNKEGSRYQYALNTITASVNVNDSLFLEDPSIIANLKRPVFERLSDSRFTPDGVEPVDDPKWRTGAIIKDEFGNDMYQGLYGIANFNLRDNGTEDNELLLDAVGYVANQDGVNIKYDWTGTSFASGEAIPGRDRDSASLDTDWVITEDLAPQAGVTYYVKKDNEMVRLTTISEPTLEEAFADASLPKYELGSSFVVTEGGIYQVDMQAFRTTSQSNGEAIISKSRSIGSIECYVPHAAIPAVTLKVAGVPESGLDDVPAYSIDDKDPEKAQDYIFVGDNAPSVKALITKDERNVLSRSSLDKLEAAVAKLAIAPADVNKEASQANQDAIEVVNSDNEIFVVGHLADLNSFASTNPAQGEAKWIGLDIATNVDDITKLTWNGYALSADDVAEAASVGLEAGHIIFWAKAEQLPKVIRIARENYGEVELKISFADADNFEIPEAAKMDEAKALDNARQGIIKESSLGRIALALVEEGAKPNFDGAELVRYDSVSEFEVPSAGASIEGIYCVYAMNERNHTQSISEPSKVINVSKIAPVVSNISVWGQENTGFDVELLRANKQVILENGNPAVINLDANHLFRNFELVVADDFSSIGAAGDRPSLSLRVVEIDQNKYRQGQLVYPQEPIDGTTDEYTPTVDPENPNKYHFTISQDQGWYIVEATTRYHGTKRISVTEPFIVTSTLNFG